MPTHRTLHPILYISRNGLLGPCMEVSLCPNRSVRLGQSVENWKGRPAPSAGAKVSARFAMPESHLHRSTLRSLLPVPTDERLGRRSWTHSLDVGITGPFLPHMITLGGCMTTARKRTHNLAGQKSQALRMLVASGVIRPATLDPLHLSMAQQGTTAPHPSSSTPPGVRLAHASPVGHLLGPHTLWPTTLRDILREFIR